MAAGATGADAVTAPASAPVPKAEAKTKAATPDRLRYDVSLRGNTDGSHWTGRQQGPFRNTSDQPLREVYARL